MTSTASQALRVTFYSYKGGVGRTLALINTAAVLAEHGRRVVIVDMDLEAPGLGFCAPLNDPRPSGHGSLGVSDWLLRRFLRPVDEPLEDFSYTSPLFDDDRLRILPAGKQPKALAVRLAHLYGHPNPPDPDAWEFGAFEDLVYTIENTWAPDFIFFDSRTGLADIAQICTVELAQVLVVVAGLNAQNVQGASAVLNAVKDHPGRSLCPDPMSGAPQPVPLARFVALSPVPQNALNVLASKTPQPINTPLTPDEQRIQDRLNAAREALVHPLSRDFDEDVRVTFPNLQRDDLAHILPYDPLVPILDELHIHRTPAPSLVIAYARLARAIDRAHPNTPPLNLNVSPNPYIKRLVGSLPHTPQHPPAS